MSRHLLLQYVKLTEFLGHALGPDYEVALHDLTDKNRSIIAIANNHVSGREVGAPLTNVALKILMDKSYENVDYRLHYNGLTAEGKKLRTSTFFIKNGSSLIGMLCINFDDSRYKEINEHILQLCHPNAFVETNFRTNEPMILKNQEFVEENLYKSIDAMATDAITSALHSMDIEGKRLTHEEKIDVVRKLEEEGIFLLKGAVKEVAAALDCSQATIYRYVSQVKHS